MATDKFVRFDVTGVLVDGRTRFKMTYTSYRWALCINLWRGSIWGVRSDGTRRLLSRVWN